MSAGAGRAREGGWCCKKLLKRKARAFKTGIGDGNRRMDSVDRGKIAYRESRASNTIVD